MKIEKMFDFLVKRHDKAVVVWYAIPVAKHSRRQK